MTGAELGDAIALTLAGIDVILLVGLWLAAAGEP